MKKLFLLIGLCIFAAAGAQKKAAGSPHVIRPEKQNTVRTVDFTGSNFPVKEYKDIAVSDYIPFETTSEVLFDKVYRLVHLSKSRIITSNQQRGDIFVFDGKGKTVSNFNHKGEGPKEYKDVGQVVYDEANKEIFIFDRSNHCQVYSEDGSHQRAFKFPESQQYVSSGNCAFDYDKETMLLYNNNESSDSLFIFLSKKDGSVKSYITFPLRANRIPNRQVKLAGDKYWALAFDFSNITKNGDTYYLSTLSSDTIYQLNKDKKLYPFLVRKPPIGKMEDETLDVLSIIKATDKYILFMETKHDIGFKSTPAYPVTVPFIYEVETQKIFSFKFDFYWIIGLTSLNANYPENLFATFCSADGLKIDLKNGSLKGKLKEVAEKLDEEDNPVLQVIKF